MTARLTALGLLAVGLAASARAADAPPASVRDAIYYGGGAPVRIRLTVSIDGKSADAAWNAAIDGLFAQADRNGDGHLDEKERAAFVAAQPRPRQVVDFGGEVPLDSLRLTFNKKDEKITRAVFGDALKADSVKRGPVTLRSVASSPNSKQLSTALFRHLDKNADGKLSADELKAARESLEFLDVDEDEFVTAAELLSRSITQNNNRVVQFPGMRQPQPTGEVAEIFFFNPDGPPAVKQLLEARGGKKATALKAGEFGSDAATFKALDKDGNGTLDTTELAAWLGGAPDLEVPITFTQESASLKPPTKELPGVRFTFEQPLRGPEADWKRATEGAAVQFKKLGKDGVVGRAAAEKQPLQLALFDLADRNGDEKVDDAELDAAVKALAPLGHCRADVSFADHGNGLFELLDRNGDNKLSPRELAGAATVLMPLAGKDQLLGPDDLIRRFIVRAGVDTIPVGVVLATRSAEMPAKTIEMPPLWFTRMDRNGDGDVSLREFLGPLEAFRKLDRDADGLISVAEALAK